MRLKILVFILAIGFLAGTYLAAKWYLDNVDRPEAEANAALKRREKASKKGNGPDPGLTVFDKAVAALRENNTDTAHERLSYLIRVYSDSARYDDARRIIGEINMDRLFSRNPMPGKYDYTVKKGDSMTLIAKGTNSTISFLAKLNNLTSYTLQPGDHLVCQPLDFRVDVIVGDRLLTLSQIVPTVKDPVFFKDYSILDINVPAGFSLKKPIECKVADKIAWLRQGGQEKRVQPIDPLYSFAKKSISTSGKSPGKLGLMLRPISERPMSEEDKKEAGGEDINYGIFLDDGDMEELNTILRQGMPVKIVN